MEHNDRAVVVRNGGKGLATIALLVAFLALVVAWASYNRTGTDLEDRIAEEVERATDSAEKGLDTGVDGVDDGAR